VLLREFEQSEKEVREYSASYGKNEIAVEGQPICGPAQKRTGDKIAGATRD